VSSTGNGAEIFDVHNLPRANDQLRRLARRAKVLGIGPQLARELRQVYRQLLTSADVWGEPTYNTHLPGGQVRLAIDGGLSIEYVVFRQQRVAWIHSIVPLFGHPLAED
jgi:hypothetical protein